MMADKLPQTIGYLRRKAIITDKEIAAAVNAYLTDPKARAYRFASDHVLNVAAAVEAHQPAKAALAEKEMKVALKLMIVRTAVILACPIQR